MLDITAGSVVARTGVKNLINNYMFSVIYEYLIHLALAAGALCIIAGFIFGFVPLIGRYKVPLQVLGLLLFSVGLWFEAGLAADRRWSDKVARVEAELADARLEGAKVTTDVVRKVITERQVIKEKGEVVIEYIDREVVKYDNVCPIPKTVVLTHNAAALNNPDLLKGVDAGQVVSTVEHNDLARPKLILAPKQ